MLKPLIIKLTERKDLTREEMRSAMETIMSGDVNPAQTAAFLIALKIKGETAAEITAASLVMKEKATKVRVKGDVIFDSCGTGGDGHGTINVSTSAAVILAAAGVTVAKHGNRSITSMSGSADVLRELGASVELPPEKVEACIEKCGLGFIFAPGYHPAMKHVMPVRKELGVRTIFNLLGPIVNPANHTHHLMGVFSESLVGTIAEVLRDTGLKRAAVVCGHGGLDELSLSGATSCAELKDGAITRSVITPEDCGLKRAPIEAVRGGSAADNARHIKELFSGDEKGPKRDIILLNAGYALYIAEKAATPAEGVKLAAETVDSGAAAKKLDEFIKASNI